MAAPPSPPPAARYRVAVDDSPAAGGDGFTGSVAATDVATDVTGGPVDPDALLAHPAATPALALPPTDRTTVLP